MQRKVLCHICIVKRIGRWHSLNMFCFSLLICFVCCAFSFQQDWFCFFYLHSQSSSYWNLILAIFWLSGRLSVTIPPVTTNSLGYGAFLAVNANLRYQLLCGVDRTMMHFFDAVGPALFCSTVLRYAPFLMTSSSCCKLIVIMVHSDILVVCGTWDNPKNHTLLKMCVSDPLHPALWILGRFC